MAFADNQLKDIVIINNLDPTKYLVRYFNNPPPNSIETGRTHVDLQNTINNLQQHANVNLNRVHPRMSAIEKRDVKRRNADLQYINDVRFVVCNLGVYHTKGEFLNPMYNLKFHENTFHCSYLKSEFGVVIQDVNAERFPVTVQRFRKIPRDRHGTIINLSNGPIQLLPFYHSDDDVPSDTNCILTSTTPAQANHNSLSPKTATIMNNDNRNDIVFVLKECFDPNSSNESRTTDSEIDGLNETFNKQTTLNSNSSVHISLDDFKEQNESENESKENNIA